MPCMSDVNFITLLNILILIYHFVKIITEQATLASFPREKEKWWRYTERSAK